MAPKKKPTKAAAAKAREEWDAKFTKTYGEGVLDNTGKIKPYEVISTGVLSLDYSMGIGGYIEGRLYEIWGPDGIGKSTLVFQGVREAQKKHPDLMVAWIDMEHAVDKPWMVAHGVNISKDALRIITPESAEDVADQVKDCLRSGLFSFVVVDSIGAMIPEAEKEKDADQAVMANQAKIVTRMVKIAAVEAHNNSTVVIFINQVRANLGYGADTTTGGGFALKHVTTGKLKLSRTGATPFQVKIPGEEKPVRIGHEVAVMNERNRVAPAYRRAQFVLMTTASAKYGPVGIAAVDDAASIGLKTKVIGQRGGYYDLPNGETVQGRENVVEALRADPDLVAQVREMALATLSGEIILGDEANPMSDAETIEVLRDSIDTLDGGASLFQPTVIRGTED